MVEAFPSLLRSPGTDTIPYGRENKVLIPVIAFSRQEGFNQGIAAERGYRNMMFSRSSEYAIRAFLYLAGQEPGKLVMARHIADEAGLPSHFLAKLLQQLARKGLVKSNKGPSGGFTLGMTPREISLYDIVDAVDGIDGFNRCPIGHVKCNEHTGCPVHDGWKSVRSRIVDYLEHTSLADVSRRSTNGKKRKAHKARSNGSRN